MADNDTTQNNDGKETTPAPAPGIHRGKVITADQWADDGVVIEEPTALQPPSVMRKDFEEANAKVNGADEDGEQETEEETEQVETADDTEESAQDEFLPPQQGIEDPGDFEPQDYSFDVIIYDEKGEKPKTVHITSVEQWDELLDTDPNLGSTTALGKAMRASTRMERGLEEDRKAWEAQKEKYDEATEQQEQYRTSVNNVANEMKYLSDKGELPKLTRDEQNMSWYKPGTTTPDPEVIKAHPNVKAWTDLVLYMRRESASRTKAGLQPLTSAIDAYNAMQLDSRHKADIEARKAAGEARKAAGSVVSGGGTTPLSAQAPKGIAVGRNLGSLQRLGQNWT